MVIIGRKSPSRSRLIDLPEIVLISVLKDVYHGFVMIRKNFSMIPNIHIHKVIELMLCKLYATPKKVRKNDDKEHRDDDDEMHSGTSLPRYYTYYPHFEAARERHIFVPKHFPNENPSNYEHKGLKYFQDVSFQCYDFATQFLFVHLH